MNCLTISFLIMRTLRLHHVIEVDGFWKSAECWKHMLKKRKFWSEDTKDRRHMGRNVCEYWRSWFMISPISRQTYEIVLVVLGKERGVFLTSSLSYSGFGEEEQTMAQ